jgi:hypothetical protein
LNIASHYGTENVRHGTTRAAEKAEPHSMGGQGAKETSMGASGFWVAELLRPDDGKPTGYIVGSIGIGKFPPSSIDGFDKLTRLRQHGQPK